MSGGSWNYSCFQFDEVADRLTRSTCPHRVALGRLVRKVGHAMHEIEWVDSGDSSSPADIRAIKAALGKDAKSLVLAVLIEQAEEAAVKLGEAIMNAKEGR